MGLKIGFKRGLTIRKLNITEIRVVWSVLRTTVASIITKVI